ncbi:16S rRNA (cytosine(1402)-N(4))-methyltransferase RsmH [Sphingopyxis witflariensis]|uniref:Ribosomal RNA small subunit methyltransferase H n=1 Tax=Sphingopyxis witflariensis TaxID=173675 RepID=A0A246K3U2_9SPHN|nr:16S rRNA (cytosine(1402)-N(4))-methyltransferase RsmH [Sphingopyxis witflariensis]OWR00129.1 16S rRNA (cytosine(1402)-N(4))-methyltransferase [Sphingopyxis witflariensis]
MTDLPRDPRHDPVLRDEIVAALAIAPGELHVDATFGAGGYTRAMLAAGANVIACDRDPDAIAEGQALVDASEGRLRLVHGRFGEIDRLLAEQGVGEVDGIVFDIGVSSMQLDRSERGFSFQKDGPLDMRMAQDGESAAEWLNRADEAEIADILFHYGDERQSRRVARAIVAARPLSRTGELAVVIRKALRHPPGAPKDPSTKSFQAIRIHINGELDELNAGLAAAERLLRPGGRLAVVSFHSTEDRIVKNFLRERSGGDAAGSRHRPAPLPLARAATFETPARKVRPSKAEEARNPRARSATLRSAVRTAAPAWPDSSTQGNSGKETMSC